MARDLEDGAVRYLALALSSIADATQRTYSPSRARCNKSTTPIEDALHQSHLILLLSVCEDVP